MIFACSQANILEAEMSNTTVRARPRERTQPARVRTQAERRDAAERAIVDAAIDIVAERGLDELTLAEAGEAAGYSRGLAAHYFGSKDELVAGIAECVIARYTTTLKASGALRTGLAGIVASIEHYFEGAASNPQSMRALHSVLGAAVTKPSLGSTIAKLNHDGAQSIAHQIKKGIGAGEIRASVDASTQSVLILAELRGVVAQWLIEPKQVDLKRMRKELVSTVKARLMS